MAQEERGEYLKYEPAPTQEYGPDHGNMPQLERVALNTLAESVRQMARARVYQKARPFYPYNASPDRIVEASKLNPELLSPYTLVERDETGGFKATPYHEAFKPQLEPVSQGLQNAAWYTQDPELKRFLLARARNLLDGNYEESEKMWLSSPMTKIRVVIGPYDRYMDKKMNRKFSFGGFVGTLDEAETAKHQPIIDRLDEAFRHSDLNNTGLEIRQRVRYDRTEVSAGIFAEMEMTANSLPCQPEWREKYGTEIIILTPPFYDKFHRFREPLIREIIAVEHRRIQSERDLRDSYGYRFDTHEDMHAWIRRPMDEERFGPEYTFMSEMSATVIGLSMLGKIGLSAKQLEGILEVELAIAADEYKKYLSGDRRRIVYLDGETVLLAALLKDGTLTVNDRGEFTWNDIGAVYRSSIDSLAKMLEDRLTNGDIDDAKSIKRQYGDYSVFEGVRPFKPTPKAPDVSIFISAPIEPHISEVSLHNPQTSVQISGES